MPDSTVENNSNICKIKKLEVETFYIIVINCFVTKLNKIMSAYYNVCNIFGFITKLC